MIKIYRDLVFETPLLYHASPKEFTFPSREKINEAREWSPWHGNGVLGLWASTRPNMCATFGKHVYEIALKPETRSIGVGYGDFKDLTGYMEDFNELISYFSIQGDVVYILDSMPFVGEVIIINFDVISRFENASQKVLEDFKQPLTSEAHAYGRGK